MKKAKKAKKMRESELKDMLKKYGASLDWMEEGELRSWVDAGNSPLDNPEGILHKDGTSLDFVEWYRSAEWVAEKVDLQPWRCFDGLMYLIEADYKPKSKKAAVKHLRQIQKYFGEELNDFIRFLNSENLMDSYENYKLLTGSGFQEELPFL